VIKPGDLVVWDASCKGWDKHPMLVLSIFNAGPGKFGVFSKECFLCHLLTRDGVIIDKYHFLLKKIV